MRDSWRLAYLALVSLALLVEVRSTAAQPASGDDSVLASKGLYQSGVYFLIRDEDEFLVGYKNLQPVVDQMRGEFVEYHQAVVNELQFQEANDTWHQIVAQARKIQQDLASLPGGKANQPIRQQWQQQLASLNRQLPDVEAERAQRASRRIPINRFDKLENDYRVENQKYYIAVKPLENLYKQITSKYAGLQRDPSVRAALRAFDERTKTRSKIGPSDRFQVAVRTLREIQREMPPFVAFQRVDDGPPQNGGPGGRRRRPPGPRALLNPGDAEVVAPVTTPPAAPAPAAAPAPRPTPAPAPTPVAVTPAVQPIETLEEVQLLMQELRFAGPDAKSHRQTRARALPIVTRAIREANQGKLTVATIDQAITAIKEIDTDGIVARNRLKIKRCLDLLDKAKQQLGSGTALR